MSVNRRGKGRKRKEMVGEKYGWYTIVEEISSISGHRRFIIECKECKEKEQIWHSQLSTGGYGKCKCEFNSWKKNVVYEGE